MFKNSEQHGPSTEFISPSYQGCTTSDNSLEPEKQVGLPVQEYDNQESPIHKTTQDQQP